MNWIVISLGGGIINSRGSPNVEFIKKFSKLIKDSKNKFAIVTGGGKSARAYAQVARELGANEFEADEIAIISTLQNAVLIALALKGEACPTIFSDFNKAKEAATKYRIIVMGGTIPGITTDSDAALLADALGAKKLINLSNVDGIYNCNPKANANAKKYSKLNYDELIALATKNDARKAGTNFVFDILACKIIARAKIEAHFINGKNLNEVKKAIEGKAHSGTVVK
ncbi:MAG: UMP kinase [Candidatus Micrarchaeota archaeon]